MTQDITRHPGPAGPGDVAIAAPPDPSMPKGDLVQWAYEARQAHQIALSLVESSFVPASLRGRPNDVTVAILAGHEMGLKPMATLRSIDVIQGTPALRAHAMRGLLQSQGHSIQLVESDDEHCVMRGRRKGEDDWQVVEWDIARAARLGLATKAQWKSQPRTMLIARATGEICRLIASDAIHAMPYVAEELDENPPIETQRVTRAEMGAPPIPPAGGPDAPASGPPPAGDDASERSETTRSEAPQEERARSARPATGPQKGKIKALAERYLGKGYAREAYLDALSEAVSRDVTSSNDLTYVEADIVRQWLEGRRPVAEQAPGNRDGGEPELLPDDELTGLSVEKLRELAADRAKGLGWSKPEFLAAAENEYAQPFDDLDADQLRRFVTGLTFQRIPRPDLEESS